MPRTRSSTKENGRSPGREHVLPPPTRKGRKGRKQTDGDPPSETSTCYLSAIFNLLKTPRGKAVLMDWLCVLLVILLVDVFYHDAPKLTRGKGANKRSAPDGEEAGRPTRRRRISPVEDSAPQPATGGHTSAVRRLLSSAASPRRGWGFRRAIKSVARFRPHLSPVEERTSDTPTSMVTPEAPQKTKCSPSPEPTPKHDPPPTTQKRKRSPIPEVIPNPPGCSYGMYEKYFEYSSEEDEDVDVEGDIKMGDTTPVNKKQKSKSHQSWSSGCIQTNVC